MPKQRPRLVSFEFNNVAMLAPGGIHIWCPLKLFWSLMLHRVTDDRFKNFQPLPMFQSGHPCLRFMGDEIHFRWLCNQDHNSWMSHWQWVGLSEKDRGVGGGYLWNNKSNKTATKEAFPRTTHNRMQRQPPEQASSPISVTWIASRANTPVHKWGVFKVTWTRIHHTLI